MVQPGPSVGIPSCTHLEPPEDIIHFLRCEVKAKLLEARVERIATTVLAHHNACVVVEKMQRGRVQEQGQQNTQPVSIRGKC